MSKSLQRRLTTSKANTWVASSYYILQDKENLMCFKHVLKCRWCRCTTARVIRHKSTSTYRTVKHWHCQRPAASDHDWTESTASAQCQRSTAEGLTLSARLHCVSTLTTAGRGSPDSSCRCAETHRYCTRIHTHNSGWVAQW